jgi:NADH-quinone oxidoreductase subunit J
MPIALFWFLAAVSLISAFGVVLQRNPLHCLLALIATLLAIAVMFIGEDAVVVGFLQAIVYAGAIMVLFVFVIMLLNAGVEERTDYSKVAKYAGLPLGIFLLLALAHWMAHSLIGQQIANGVGGTNASVSTRELSAQLFQKYLFPFEATSILILIAILGALVLAKKDE